MPRLRATAQAINRARPASRAICLVVLCGVWWGGCAFAQTGAFAEMRQLLDQGFYALAAQVEGPKLVDRFADDPEAHYLYAKALYLTGDVSRARDVLDAALATTDTPPARYWQLSGLLAAASGDGVTAQTRLERAWRLEPSYPIAMDLGRIAWQAGDLGTALAAYEAAATTEAGMGEPWPHLNRARLLLIQDRPDEAVGVLEATLDILDRTLDTTSATLPSPAYAEAFYRLGQAYEARGDLAQALANYEAASLTDPTYQPARDALGRLSTGTSPPLPLE